VAGERRIPSRRRDGLDGPRLVTLELPHRPTLEEFFTELARSPWKREHE
jgi:hypothetical protein